MIVIKKLRTERNLAQKDLAEKLNVEAYTVSDWEQGRCEPSIDMLIKIADYFGVTIDYLVNHKVDFYDYTKFSLAQLELINYIKNLNDKEVTRILGYVDAIADNKKAI